MTLKPTSSQGSGGGGSGTVTQVSSADTSVAVATGTTTPVLTVAPLNTIAANSAASGDVAMNSHKLTGLAAGSASGNSVRYEQVLGGANALAVNNLVAGSAGQVLGGTGPSYALPPGYEIGYTQITSPVAVASTTEATGTTVISPGALTFDGGLVMVEFSCPYLVCGAVSNGEQVAINLFESTTNLGRFLAINVPEATSSALVPACGRFRFTPTAGAHTYVVTAYASATTNTPTVGAGAGGTAAFMPAFVRFTKV